MTSQLNNLATQDSDLREQRNPGYLSNASAADLVKQAFGKKGIALTEVPTVFYLTAGDPYNKRRFAANLPRNEPRRFFGLLQPHPSAFLSDVTAEDVGPGIRITASPSEVNVDFVRESSGDLYEVVEVVEVGFLKKCYRLAQIEPTPLEEMTLKQGYGPFLPRTGSRGKLRESMSNKFSAIKKYRLELKSTSQIFITPIL